MPHPSTDVPAHPTKEPHGCDARRPGGGLFSGDQRIVMVRRMVCEAVTEGFFATCSGVHTREDMDLLYRRAVPPGCFGLLIAARCCGIDAGTKAVYHQGAVHLRCARCEAPIIAIAVAHTRPKKDAVVG